MDFEPLGILWQEGSGEEPVQALAQLFRSARGGANPQCRIRVGYGCCPVSHEPTISSWKQLPESFHLMEPGGSA